MGQFRRQFDGIVEKAVLHYAKEFKKTHADVRIVICLRRKIFIKPDWEEKKKWELVFELLIDMVKVRELRFLEDILLKNFDIMGREMVFGAHVKRILLGFSQTDNISGESIRAMITLVSYKDKKGRDAFTTAAHLFDGRKFFKTISQSDIFSDENIAETALTLSDDVTDNN